MMCEGLAAALDPTFRLTGVLVPYAQRLLLAEYAPAAMARKLSRAGLEAAHLGAELPEQVRRLLFEAEHGGLEVGVRPEQFDSLVRRLERVGNQIVLALLAGSFIVGLPMLMSVYRPPGWEQWVGGVFVFGFVLASVLGVYLAVAILRSGRG
jgi:predicted unusual protein kinase regulating ubiquinone biosynthesis (AarF/ABC1/UbiB family)